jgi:hypothetical protein
MFTLENGVEYLLDGLVTWPLKPPDPTELRLNNC